LSANVPESFLPTTFSLSPRITPLALRTSSSLSLVVPPLTTTKVIGPDFADNLLGEQPWFVSVTFRS
jgi:hypothetical protein